MKPYRQLMYLVRTSRALRGVTMVTENKDETLFITFRFPSPGTPKIYRQKIENGNLPEAKDILATKIIRKIGYTVFNPA